MLVLDFINSFYDVFMPLTFLVIEANKYFADILKNKDISICKKSDAYK